MKNSKWLTRSLIHLHRGNDSLWRKFDHVDAERGGKPVSRDGSKVSQERNWFGVRHPDNLDR